MELYADRWLRVRFKCKICGETNDFRWSDRRNLKCACCQGNRHNCTQNSLQVIINQKYNHLFSIVEFVSLSDSVKLQCRCGFIFSVLPCSLLRERGIRCPNCQHGRSKGELKIETILKRSNIKFECEKHFDWLPLHWRYDFYLPDQNLLIEFQGEQHYSYVSYFYKSPLDWERAVERDNKKMTLALANNFSILCIPYNLEPQLSIIFHNLIGSTTIWQQSKGIILEAQDFIHKEDIV